MNPALSGSHENRRRKETGIEKCRELVDSLTREATDALSAFDADTSSLHDFALALARRTN